MHPLRPRVILDSIAMASVMSSASDVGATSPATTPTFRQIYHDYFDFVWRFARSLGIPRDQLDDAVQDVFVVVSRRIHTFEGRSSLKTWVGGVARNVILDRLRRLASSPAHESLDERAQDVEDPGSPDRSAEVKAAAEVMNRILAEMTHLQREVFILCDVEEFSAVEVSQMLQTNENTVRTRLRSARATFKAALAAKRDPGENETMQDE